MLLQLEEPPEELCEEFLSHAGTRLEAELAALEAELPPSDPSGAATTPPPASDILDFVDRGSSAFVGNLCLLAASYRSLFEGRPGAGDGRLEAFAAALTARYFALLERRLGLERGLGDTSLLVRALDRFHRRLRALLELLPAAGAEAGAALVARAARERVDRYLRALQTFFLGCLGDVRQALAAPRPPGKEGPGLPDLLATLASSVLGQLKAVLAYVQLFTAKDVAFASLPYFKVGSGGVLGLLGGSPGQPGGGSREFGCCPGCVGTSHEADRRSRGVLEVARGGSELLWGSLGMLGAPGWCLWGVTPPVLALRGSSVRRRCARGWWWPLCAGSAAPPGALPTAPPSGAPPLRPQPCSCCLPASAWTMRRPPSATSSHSPMSSFPRR